LINEYSLITVKYVPYLGEMFQIVHMIAVLPKNDCFLCIRK